VPATRRKSARAAQPRSSLQKGREKGKVLHRIARRSVKKKKWGEIHIERRSGREKEGSPRPDKPRKEKEGEEVLLVGLRPNGGEGRWRFLLPLPSEEGERNLFS